MSADPEASQFEATEELLRQWGRYCDSRARMSGVPTFSMVGTIEARREKEKEEREAKRKKLRAELREQREAHKAGGPPPDPKLVAEASGHIEPTETAKGKSTPPKGEKPGFQHSGKLGQIDYIVTKKLLKWQKKCIMRSYLYGERDKDAADALKMPTGEYSRRRRAAVWAVAEKLDQRYIRSVVR